MTPIAIEKQLESDVREVVDLFRRDETAEFIATEFMIATGLRQGMKRGGKLDRAVRQAEREIVREGFQWWSAPLSMRMIVNSVRAAMQSMDENAAQSLIYSLLREDDPQVIRHVDVG